MWDDGGSREQRDTIIDEGTESEQDAAAQEWAREECDDWARGGDWGDAGACVVVRYTLSDSDSDSEWEGRVDVEIEPDHDALIRDVGGDTECEHEWTREGQGGCDENPGVWSLGGTAMKYSEHCAICGLRRTITDPGEQRNPGECDTWEYSLPEASDEPAIVGIESAEDVRNYFRTEKR